MNIPLVMQNYKDFPLFTGIFNDFDPKWYKNIGATICLSMLINSISGQAGYLGSYLFNQILRCCDGCSCDGKTTKKRTKREYMNLFVGPTFDIGARYSEVIILTYKLLDTIYDFRWIALFFRNASYVCISFTILALYILRGQVFM